MLRKLALLTVTLLLVACAPKTEDGKTIYYQDNFEDTGSGWPRDSYPEGLNDYQDGGYRILVDETFFSAWYVREFTDTNDVSLEADAENIGDMDANELGLVCRHVDTENFYAGVITSDGYYGIVKIVAGEYQIIGSDVLNPTDAINLGQQSNHIQFDCVGDQLSLYANGVLLDEATDTDYASGDVGLYAGTFDLPGADVLFDNFVVHEP